MLEIFYWSMVSEAQPDSIPSMFIDLQKKEPNWRGSKNSQAWSEKIQEEWDRSKMLSITADSNRVKTTTLVIKAQLCQKV